MKTLTTVAVCALFLLPNHDLFGQVITIEMMSPVVIESTPQSGAVNVDPTITELRVTFSKDMKTDSWSCLEFSNESWPQLAPRGFTKDKRTFVATVKLQPSKTYVVQINDQDHNNFKDATGRSVMPYIIAFRTRE